MSSPRQKLARKRLRKLTKAIRSNLRLKFKLFLLADGSRQPFSGTHGYKDASGDEQFLLHEAESKPFANLACATGQESKCVVVDIDTHDGDGFASLKKLENRHGKLPETLTYVTPRAGEHRFFRYPKQLRSFDPAEGINVLGDGSYCTLYPSFVKEGRYRCINDRDLAPLPTWLVSLARKRLPKSMDADPVGRKIAEGERNRTLTSVAGALRRRGHAEDLIVAELHQQNLQQCVPPLEAREIESIARSVSKYPTGSTSNFITSLNDSGNAQRYKQMFGARTRKVLEPPLWLVWQKGRWFRDPGAVRVYQRAQKVAQSIFAEAEAEPDKGTRKALMKHANGSLQHGRLNTMIAAVGMDRKTVVEAAKLDANPLLLGVKNGVVDLSTGRLRKARRDDLITCVSPVKFDPKATAPKFIAFVKKIMKDDKDMCRFLLRLIGYCLIGDGREQVMFFFYGKGKNGKSTLISVLNALFGPELCKTTPAETLMGRPGARSATNDLARLESTRLTTSTEIKEGCCLDEQLIKQLTGGDPVTARAMYKDFNEYIPKMKIIMQGNYRPVIMGDDDAIWRRVNLIPFMYKIPEADRIPDFAKVLRKELPGILKLAVTGCLDYQKRGLAPPLKVVNACTRYREDMDTFGRWVQDCVHISAKATWRALDVYTDYCAWAKLNGLKAMSNPRFGTKLVERLAGKKVRTKKGHTYVGIGPKHH